MTLCVFQVNFLVSSLSASNLTVDNLSVKNVEYSKVDRCSCRCSSCHAVLCVARPVCIWVHTSPSHPVAGACATLSGPACSRSAFEKSAREYIFRGNELNELCVKRRAVKGATESCTTLSCLTTVLGHYSLENPGKSVDHQSFIIIIFCSCHQARVVASPRFLRNHSANVVIAPKSEWPHVCHSTHHQRRGACYCSTILD
jgi:hypothetical protein